MNISNRYEIEMIARHTQANLEKQLHRRGQLQMNEPVKRLAPERGSHRAALIVAGAGGLGALLALGVSYGLAFAFALAR